MSFRPIAQLPGGAPPVDPVTFAERGGTYAGMEVVATPDSPRNLLESLTEYRSRAVRRPSWCRSVRRPSPGRRSEIPGECPDALASRRAGPQKSMAHSAREPAPPARIPHHRPLCALWLGWLWIWPALVQAQGASVTAALEGTWRAGTTTMNVTVESWGEDCGPRPQSSRTSGGGTVRISAEGPELLIHGKGHLVRTDECWSRNPAIRRASSRFLTGKWTTQCQTPADDPREEKGTYSITQVSETELRYVDVSEYNWKLNDSRCAATITTVQTLLRSGAKVGKKAAAEPEPTADPDRAASTPQRRESAAAEQQVRPAPAQRGATDRAREPTSEPRRRACTPGLASEVVIKPTEAEVELGQELCVRARAVDADGCPLPAGVVSYRLEHSAALKAELDGPCFVASQSAAEGEGEFKLIASAGDLSAETRILVSSRDLSSLIAKRLEVGAVTGFETPSEDADEPPAAPPPATRVSAQQVATRTSGRGPLILALLGLAILVLSAALVILRRRQGTTQAIAAEATTGPSPPSQDPQKNATAARAAAAADPSRPPKSATLAYGDSAPPIETWICPNCRRGFPAIKLHCPRCLPEEHRLLPYPEFQAQQMEQATPKRCQDCGTTWPGSTNFCGQCGSRNLRNTVAPPGRRA